jgi:hypothetical protein
MQTQQANRRADHDIDKAGIVRQGMRIQARLGTIGAVEYLKARDVGGAVIRRVLTSQQVRADDR